ncbi:MAG: response regulator, partial [Desulfosarcina sp.]
VTCDAEGVLTYYNDQAVQIWGRTPAIGDTDQRFCGSYRLYREDATPLAHEQTPMATVLRHATRIRGQEIIIERPDGSRAWVSVNIDPLFDEQEHPCGAISVFTDITERKQAEALLEQSEKRLRVLNENLEQEVADRTEIANLRTKQLQTLTVELIEAEEAERNRIAQLLHDDLQQMLASANLQLQTATHQSPADPILVNVGETLERSISKARRLSHELSPPVLKHTSLNAGFGWLSRIMEEQFNLNVQLDTVAAPSVEYDSLKTFIFRAAQELLFNVVKHAGVQTARIVLSQIDKCLVLSVSDQGRGFDAGCLDNRSFKKTGLGLRSLRERASYMGGSLEIEGGPDQGSRVILTIPLNGVGLTQPRRRMTDRKTNRPNESPGQTDMGRLRVVFVDDHPMMREGLIKMVATIPTIEVVGEASNGHEAIEQVGYLKPDVVVMDVSMPKMNGIEATYQIKQKYPDVRVIGLSMFNEEEISLQMRQAGAETLVCKSASSAELLKAIYGATQDNQRIVEE